MISKQHSTLFLIWFLGSSIAAYAQGSLGNSPLTRQPYGEYVMEGFSRNRAMGGASIGSPSGDYINIENPALLWYNRTSNLEAVLQGQIRNISDKTNSQRTGGVVPVNFGLAFPIGSKTSMAFGVKPLSFTDYNVSFNEPVAGIADTVNYQLKGSGGMSKAFVGAGYNIGGGFTLGIEGGFTFGNLTYDRNIRFYGSNEPISNIQSTNRYIGFNAKPAIAFRRAVDSTKKRYITFGVVYDYGFDMNLTRKNTYQLLADEGLPYYSDTLNSVSGFKVGSPSTISFGMAYAKEQHYTFAFDAAFTNWSNYKDPSGNLSDIPNTTRFALGYEWIPNLYSGNYLNIIAYRFGVSYKSEPIKLNNNQVSDLKVTAGLGFPVIRKEARYMRPYINLSVFAGQRAILATHNLSEYYFGASLGITLNDTQWFRRFRIE
jgi:hypothetical protein